MKVKELIEKLSEADPDDIVVYHDNNYYGDLSLNKVEIDKRYGTVRIS